MLSRVQSKTLIEVTGIVLGGCRVGRVRESKDYTTVSKIAHPPHSIRHTIEIKDVCKGLKMRRLSVFKKRTSHKMWR